jgi:hypothetical protein
MAMLMLLWDEAPGAARRHLRRNLRPSASLRARWLPGGSYPGWLWHAARLATRQLASRPRGV